LAGLQATPKRVIYDGGVPADAPRQPDRYDT
jgi:hypothetical protein